MAFISATAPEVSWEEWEAEIANLDDEEKEMVNGDLNGTAAILLEKTQTRPDFLQQALVNMETALSNIPASKKRDYVNALQAAPHVVQEESNPLTFLRAACYNPEDAANRVVAYWKLRVEVFQERAFLPMRLPPLPVNENDGGGNGADGDHTELLVPQQQQEEQEQRETAMREQDLAPLQEGIVRILPPDTYGRCVFYADRGTWILPQHRECVIRCIIYLFTALSMDHSDNFAAQRHGILLLMDIRKLLLECYDRRQSRLFLTWIRDASPLCVRAVHAMMVCEKSAPMLFTPTGLWLLGRRLRLRWRLHYGTNQTFVSDFGKVGLTEKSMPELIGGSATLGDFNRWVDHQRKATAAHSQPQPVEELSNGASPV